MSTLDLNHENYVTVNGKRFHYIWLRDHDRSEKSLHPTSLQRIFDVSQLSEPPKPKSVKLEGDALVIEWAEEPNHQSIYPVEWLMQHTYDRPSNDYTTGTDVDLGDIYLWDAKWLTKNTPERLELSVEYEVLLHQLHRLGFVLLKNMKAEELEPFITAIGPIYRTLSGPKVWRVKSTPQVRDDIASAKEGFALLPHTDNTAHLVPPIIQFLHCVENAIVGGESMLVDGFRVASEIRQNHPEQFRILSDIPLMFHGFTYHSQCYFQSRRPIIGLDRRGQVAEICYTIHRRATLDVPFDQMEAFYEAYVLFSKYITDPKYCYRFRLEPGDCLLTQSHRLLHGRQAFKPDTGEREMQTAYLAWEHFVARWRFNTNQHLFAKNYGQINNISRLESPGRSQR